MVAAPRCSTQTFVFTLHAKGQAAGRQPSKRPCQGDEVQKLCFCETPSSREPWRFGQEREIPVGPCPKPIQKINRAEYRKDFSALVQVGHQVVGVPFHWASWAKPSRSDAMLIVDLDTHRLGSVLNTAKTQPLVESQQLAVLNGRVYGIAANCLLVIVPWLRASRPFCYSEEMVLLHEVSLQCNLINLVLGTCLMRGSDQ